MWGTSRRITRKTHRQEISRSWLIFHFFSRKHRAQNGRQEAELAINLLERKGTQTRPQRMTIGRCPAVPSPLLSCLPNSRNNFFTNTEFFANSCAYLCFSRTVFNVGDLLSQHLKRRQVTIGPSWGAETTTSNWPSSKHTCTTSPDGPTRKPLLTSSEHILSNYCGP